MKKGVAEGSQVCQNTRNADNKSQEGDKPGRPQFLIDRQKSFGLLSEPYSIEAGQEYDDGRHAPEKTHKSGCYVHVMVYLYPEVTQEILHHDISGPFKQGERSCYDHKSPKV